MKEAGCCGMEWRVRGGEGAGKALDVRWGVFRP